MFEKKFFVWYNEVIIGRVNNIVIIYFFLDFSSFEVYVMKKNSSHELPFGPYLSIAAIILLLSGIDVVNVLVNM